jgi:hypothetical protein
MSAVNHQTVRLSVGRSVCPVIAAFLRTYNDRVDPERRDDLYACAALVVGSRADRVAVEERIARCREVIDELRPSRLPRPVRAMLTRLLEPSPSAAGMRAAQAFLSHGPGGHEPALAFVEELVGTGRVALRRPASVEAGPGHAGPAAIDRKPVQDDRGVVLAVGLVEDREEDADLAGLDRLGSA